MTRAADIPAAATRRIQFVILMPRDARSLTASVHGIHRIMAGEASLYETDGLVDNAFGYRIAKHPATKNW